jgi:hypothetical protein
MGIVLMNRIPLHRFAIAAAIAASLCCTSAWASEGAQRRELYGDVAYHLSKDNFAELEKLQVAFLDPGQRFPSGTWKRWFFYSALEDDLGSETSPTYWRSIEARAAAWRARYPSSSAAVIFSAQVQLYQAWLHRGHTYAYKVRDWEPVRQHARRAYDALQQGGEAARADPAWYQMMIGVLQLHAPGSDEMRRMVDEGVRRHPAYHGIYFAAAGVLLPKWGGSQESLERFIDEAAERSSATERRAMYARIYWSLDASDFKGKLFSQSKADWSKMRAAFDDLVDQYPDPWNVNAYARFACLAKDRATLSALLARLGDRADFNAWGRRGKAEFDECMAYAESGGK